MDINRRESDFQQLAFYGRKVEKEVHRAFWLGKSRKIRNYETDGEALYLHGNKIAWWTNEGIMITLAGWPSVTTRSRLSHIPGNFGVYQTKHQQICQVGDSPPFKLGDSETVFIPYDVLVG